MKAPEWTLAIDETFCRDVGIGMRMLSVSTPGVNYISDPKEAAAVARSMNEYSASLRDQNPKSIGFFATIPPLNNTELALTEIRFALDNLRADGITLFTSYGHNVYLGNDAFVPIWKELSARKTVVFVHPTDNGQDAVLFHPNLPAPAFDWPHETGRTAMDMILHRRLQQFPDVKIILSHAGGTLPGLIRRSELISYPEFGGFMSAKDLYDQAQCFYFDTALSGSQEVLPQILGFAKKGHLLFGSDFPHATDAFSKVHAKFVDDYPMSEEKRKEVYQRAAEALFPRLEGMF